MNQNCSPNWTKNELYIFRLLTVYFLLYLIFVSQPFGSYYQVFDVYQFSGNVIANISMAFLRLINDLVLHQPMINADYSSDTFWGYTIVICLFLIAFVVALVWSLFDKKKSYPVFIYLLHTLARYYLGFTLISYGTSKVFGYQFFIPDWGLITDLSELGPNHVLWSFMASSKSYQFFGGLMEIIPGILLLFKRTSLLGALFAIPVLVNVLMLNIGYNVALKLVLFHLIVFALFILAPDIKRLINFFWLNKAVPRSQTPPTIGPKNKWIYYTLKFAVILFIVFTDVKYAMERTSSKPNLVEGTVLGMHKVEQFHLTNEILSKPYSTYWKKFAIYPNNQILVQFINDSISWHPIRTDTILRSIELLSKNDTAFCKLHYSKIEQDDWMFKGVFKNDSLQFVSTKIDLNKTPLRKGRGKTKWVY